MRLIGQIYVVGKQQCMTLAKSCNNDNHAIHDEGDEDDYHDGLGGFDDNDDDHVKKTCTYYNIIWYHMI